MQIYFCFIGGWRVGKDDLCVPFWTFHSVPAKNLHFLQLESPSQLDGVVGKDGFPVQIWTFYAIPSKKYFSGT